MHFLSISVYQIVWVYNFSSLSFALITGCRTDYRPFFTISDIFGQLNHRELFLLDSVTEAQEKKKEKKEYMRIVNQKKPLGSQDLQFQSKLSCIESNTLTVFSTGSFKRRKKKICNSKGNLIKITHTVICLNSDSLKLVYICKQKLKLSQMLSSLLIPSMNIPDSFIYANFLSILIFLLQNNK